MDRTGAPINICIASNHKAASCKLDRPRWLWRQTYQISCHSGVFGFVVRSQHFGDGIPGEALEGELTMWHEYDNMMTGCNTRSASHDQPGPSLEDLPFGWVHCTELADPLLRGQRQGSWTAPASADASRHINLGIERYTQPCD